jgi:hypothetical protein
MYIHNSSAGFDIPGQMITCQAHFCVVFHKSIVPAGSIRDNKRRKIKD